MGKPSGSGARRVSVALTVTSPLHPELQGYHEEEGGGRGERATRLSEPTGPPDLLASAAMASDGRYRPLSDRPGGVYGATGASSSIGGGDIDYERNRRFI